MRRRIVSIVGDAFIEPGSLKYKMAYEAAKALVDHGYRVQSGGLRGVMEAAFAGAHASDKYREGDTVAIVPGFDPNDANEYADIAIPTGLDLYRNVIVANASAVVAIGGGGGTLAEISNAWALKRMVLAFNNVEGWSAKVADTRLDQRIRYEEIPDDRIYGVSSAEEMIELLEERLDKYNITHKGIPTNR
ncbi:MAG: acyl-CoA synthetase [Clostridia bacterium]|nr:acyl-CoA synthetase [Clostridia bacterium]